MKQTNLVKILIRGVSIVLILIVSITAQSQGYEEGVHYTIIDQHQGGLQKRGAGDNEVVEYFSFSCAGCYSFESSISALLRTQPSTPGVLGHPCWKARATFDGSPVTEVVPDPSLFFPAKSAGNEPFGSRSEPGIRMTRNIHLRSPGEIPEGRARTPR